MDRMLQFLALSATLMLSSCATTMVLPHGIEMKTTVNHPILGKLTLEPGEWHWSGIFRYGDREAELSLETFRHDQIPGLHITNIVDEYVQGLRVAERQSDACLQRAAEWICSDFPQWFEDEPRLKVDEVRARLTISCVVVYADGTICFWIREPHLYDTGHEIGITLSQQGDITYIELGG